MLITKTGMCRGIQIQRLLRNPVTIIQEPGQRNPVQQIKVAKNTVPHHGQKVPCIKLPPGVSLVVVIDLPVRAQVAKATGLQGHQAVLRDLHIVLPGHQVVPQGLQFDHRDHQVVPQDLHPGQVVQGLPVQEERDKSAC